MENQNLLDSEEMRKDILLETGTNELEILEFFLGDQSFGLNVAKVMQILTYDPALVTAMPDTRTEMRGVLLWRERLVPLFDLGAILRKKPVEVSERTIIIITEFNGVDNAFVLDGVRRIHRLSWQSIQSPSQLLERYSARITGSVNIDQNEIMLLDFERIISEMSPGTKIGYAVPDELPVDERRAAVKVMLAEDSGFIRAMIKQNLVKYGYTNIREFENGEDLFKLLQSAKAAGHSANSTVDILITDIEMPKMDGLALCKYVKTEPFYAKIPVVVFSSLINEQMVLKCKEVGADGYITKPEIGTLVGLIDGMCLKKAVEN